MIKSCNYSNSWYLNRIFIFILDLVFIVGFVFYMEDPPRQDHRTKEIILEKNEIINNSMIFLSYFFWVVVLSQCVRFPSFIISYLFDCLTRACRKISPMATNLLNHQYQVSQAIGRVLSTHAVPYNSNSCDFVVPNNHY